MNYFESSACLLQDLNSIEEVEEDSSFAGTEVGGFLCDEDDLGSIYVDDEGLLLDLLRAEHDEQNVKAGFLTPMVTYEE